MREFWSTVIQCDKEALMTPCLVFAFPFDLNRTHHRKSYRFQQRVFMQSCC